MRPFVLRWPQPGPSALADAFVQERLESRLAGLPLREPVLRPVQASLQEVLSVMQRLHIGSVLLTDGPGLPVGILTRGDVLERVTLAGLSLQTPVSAVMTQPVLSVDANGSALDAAVLMAQHGLRHLPVVRAGCLLGLVSEHDLLALQSQSLAHVSAVIARAAEPGQWQQAADQIRRLTRQLLVQGLQSRPLTRLISRLNDKLTRRVIDLTLERHGLSQARMCCLTLGQWSQRFANWIEQGSAQELLKASVFFDLRPLAGRTDWAQQLGQQVARRVARTPRFVRQWVVNHVAMTEPFNWYGGLRTQRRGGQAMFNVKGFGTALLVDAARILALSQGVQTSSTDERLEQAGRLLNIPADEYCGWITAFDHLQRLRLEQQMRAGDSPADGAWVAVAALDQVNRRMLKASLRAMGGLRQRLTLDYLR